MAKKKKAPTNQPNGCDVVFDYPSLAIAQAAAANVVAYLKGGPDAPDVACFLHCAGVIQFYVCSTTDGLTARGRPDGQDPIGMDELISHLEDFQSANVDVSRLPWGKIFITIISIVLPFLI
jgi:hypothetical protein